MSNVFFFKVSWKCFEHLFLITNENKIIEEITEKEEETECYDKFGDIMHIFGFLL